MSAAERRVEVGRIVAVHGVRGDLKLESWTQPRSRIFDYQPWMVVAADGSERAFAEATGRAHGKGLLAQLPGVDDRDQARALIGSRVCIARSVLPELPHGEYYWADLVGLAVRNMDDAELGRVEQVLATGANDVLVLVDNAGQERLVPFVPDTYIKDVDLESGQVRVDWDPEF